jgi:hypothetical protein
LCGPAGCAGTLFGLMADDDGDGGGSMDVDLSGDDGLAVHDGEQQDHGDEAESAEQLLPAASDKETSSSVSEADQALHAKYAGISAEQFGEWRSASARSARNISHLVTRHTDSMRTFYTVTLTAVTVRTTMDGHTVVMQCIWLEDR